jgi:hypothetical protein
MVKKRKFAGSLKREEFVNFSSNSTLSAFSAEDEQKQGGCINPLVSILLILNFIHFNA